MIFQHTWRLVLSGEKTQTRRLCKPGEWSYPTRVSYTSSVRTSSGVSLPHNMAGRIKWEVGRDYAVQPGRTLPGVGRILIREIRKVDVREITWDDVAAEGFATPDEFLSLWERMHGENYQAWALTFELYNTPKTLAYNRAVAAFVSADEALKTARNRRASYPVLAELKRWRQFRFADVEQLQKEFNRDQR